MADFTSYSEDLGGIYQTGMTLIDEKVGVNKTEETYIDMIDEDSIYLHLYTVNDEGNVNTIFETNIEEEKRKQLAQYLRLCANMLERKR